MARSFRMISAFLPGLALHTAHAQRSAAPWAERLDPFVKHITDSLSIVGQSVGVGQHGEVVLTKGYGMHSPGLRHPVDAHTALLRA